MSLIKSYYFESKNVKVFPTAFRGQYSYVDKEGILQTLIFDPEARLNTEYNFVNTSGTNSYLKSYVIDFNSTSKILKCVIGGYYFEISNIDLNDFKDNNGHIKTLFISTRPADINSADTTAQSIENRRSTYVLKNMESEDSSLDIKDESATEPTYYFTGIKVIYDDTNTVSSAN